MVIAEMEMEDGKAPAFSAPSDEELGRLAQKASDRDWPEPPAPVQTDGWFWRVVDRAGRYAAVAAAGLCLLALGLGVAGGPEFAWASILYLPVFLLLLLYIPYLLRRRRQEKAAEYLLRERNLESARREVARVVLEQSHRDHKPD